MATTKITSNLITDDAVTGGKLNPAFVQETSCMPAVLIL